MFCQGWKPLFHTLSVIIPSPSMVLVTTHLLTILKLNYWTETNFILASKLYIHLLLTTSTRMSCRQLKVSVSKLNSKYVDTDRHIFSASLIHWMTPMSWYGNWKPETYRKPASHYSISSHHILSLLPSEFHRKSPSLSFCHLWPELCF